jgi:peroxisomal 2,4-dienoyl-CoA reductase
VAITGRRQNVLDSSVQSLKAEGISALGLQGDVRDAEACERCAAGAVQQLGGIDILVNCAAGNFLAAAEQLSAKGFRTVMDIDAVRLQGRRAAARCPAAARP